MTAHPLYSFRLHRGRSLSICQPHWAWRIHFYMFERRSNRVLKADWDRKPLVGLGLNYNVHLRWRFFRSKKNRYSLSILILYQVPRPAFSHCPLVFARILGRIHYCVMSSSCCAYFWYKYIIKLANSALRPTFPQKVNGSAEAIFDDVRVNTQTL